MRMRQLEYFVRASQLKSISQAAEQLNVAQTALGTQIRNLESEMNTALMIRTARGVSLTSEGEIFYEWCIDILERYRLLRQQLNVSTPGISTLSVGLANSVISTSGANIIQSMSARYPSIRMQVNEGHSHALLERLAAGEMDIGFFFVPISDQSLLCTPLLEEELLLVGSRHEPPGERSVDPAIALNRPLVIPSDEDDVVRKIVLQQMIALGVKPNIAFEVQSISTMKQLVVNDLALAILPVGCIADDYLGGRVRYQQIDSPSFRRTLYMVRKPRLDDGVAELLSSVVADGYARLTEILRRGD